MLLVGGALIAAPGARAQQKALPVVGVLRTATAVNDHGNDAFRRGLRELGYVEGQNILVEIRGRVVMTKSSQRSRLLNRMSGSTPIVMSVINDPVALGVAQSLAHPSGNLTGLSNVATGIVGKRLQMLVETVPNPGCVAVLYK